MNRPTDRDISAAANPPEPGANRSEPPSARPTPPSQTPRQNSMDEAVVASTPAGPAGGDVPSPATPGVWSPSARERRGEKRKSLLSPAVLVVLDGSQRGQRFDISTRDLSLSGMSFLLREPLKVGQTCQIEMGPSPGRLTVYVCEVVRSRPVTNGRHEIGVKVRERN